ncbi:hypothetical protein VNO78_17998 [Psophocarpus tetragonolobus]|uniref:NAB domain-containing protein n=1 Tax=Psophocarpus tetragonolobus TaxID=3891 RepID=A0AAN9XL26_PSOTE
MVLQFLLVGQGSLLLFFGVLLFSIHRLLGITKSKRRRVKKEKMAGMTKNQPSHWWWLDSHTSTNRSPWLESTLSELNEKTRAMLKLIEEDADSFAKRAEMYYKKRPELVSMVEDFYRTHRSLAERYDQVKPDTTGIGHLVTGGSPFASAKNQLEKLMTFSDNGYDSYSEHCDVYESEESEVDDPDQEEEEGTKFLHNCTKKEQTSFVAVSDEVIKLRDEVKRLNEENKAHKDQMKQKDTICDEVMKLREEIGRLRDDNEAQKEQLKQKDEEKIEVIRQLSLAVDVLKQENVKMRNFIAKESTKKWKNPFDEINKLVGAFSVKLFNATPKNQPGVELSRRGLQSYQFEAQGWEGWGLKELWEVRIMMRNKKLHQHLGWETVVQYVVIEGHLRVLLR